MSNGEGSLLLPSTECEQVTQLTPGDHDDRHWFPAAEAPDQPLPANMRLLSKELSGFQTSPKVASSRSRLSRYHSISLPSCLWDKIYLPTRGSGVILMHIPNRDRKLEPLSCQAR